MKKGISPVIATVLLVGLVIVTGLIVFAWFRGFTQETVTKFGGENIELACNDLQFEASYSSSSNTLSVSNVGNVPIYGINVKITKEASFSTEKIRDLSDKWPENGLGQGQVFSGNMGSTISSGDEVILIPVLIGTTGSDEKTHVCGEQYGKQFTA